jgi:acyl-CoA thioester hydrolase
MTPLHRLTPARFAAVRPMTVRWADVDMYGHLNNAAYYQLFDTVINAWTAEEAGYDPVASPVIGVVAESACRFLGEIRFGVRVRAAVGVRALGRSSVTYALALFGESEGEDGDGDGARLAAFGHWVHVYVRREDGTATAPPPEVRELLEKSVGEFPEFHLGRAPGAR